MIRRLMVSGLLLSALAVVPSRAPARVSVQLGINLPAPPQLVPVPDTPVMYAPGVPANYFFYGGGYYVYAGGAWYLGRGYNGPWVVVAPAYVPRPILAVPLGYYRVPPRGWRRGRHEAPPHWASRWGRRWEEHPEHPRGGHRERGHEEHRRERG